MTSVAVVVLDTVRKDVFDEAFDWIEGTRFEHAYSTSHWTGAAHASLFTGRYPSEVAVTVDDWTLSTDRPVLAERLQTAGYDTRAYSANINVSAPYGYDRGFDHFEGTWRLALPRETVFNWFRHLEENDDPTALAYARGLGEAITGPYETATSLRLGLQQLKRAYDIGTTDEGAAAFRRRAAEYDVDGPTFLFANLMEAHQPYRVPSAYRSTAPCDLGPAFEATFRNAVADPGAPDRDPPAIDTDHAQTAYRDCVAYLADVYRDAYASLRSSFDYVITVSDHGEAFGEDGVYEHGYGLSPALTHVPLVVSGPGFDDETREDPVSLLDVHHTVLALADGVDPVGRGRDLRQVATPTYLTEYHGIATMRRETLRDRGYPPSAIDAVDVDYRGLVAEDYYGYESDTGWTETGTSPQNPQDRLATLRESVPDARADDASVAVDDAVARQLEDLGYR